MRSSRSWLFVIACLLAAQAAAADFGISRLVNPRPEHSERDRDRGRVERSERSDERVSLDQAVDRVLQMGGGRVLSAQEGRDSHRVKVLSRSGEVRAYRVDTRSGRISGD